MTRFADTCFEFDGFYGCEDDTCVELLHRCDGSAECETEFDEEACGGLREVLAGILFVI